MQILLNINNPSKLNVLTNLLDELQFVSNIQVLEAPEVSEDATTFESREASLAKIMKGIELPSFGDGLAFQKSVRADRELPFREN